MSIHNICFLLRNKKTIDPFQLEKNALSRDIDQTVWLCISFQLCSSQKTPFVSQ